MRVSRRSRWLVGAVCLVVSGCTAGTSPWSLFWRRPEARPEGPDQVAITTSDGNVPRAQAAHYCARLSRYPHLAQARRISTPGSGQDVIVWTFDCVY